MIDVQRNDAEKLARALPSLRQAMGLTQKELGARAGISHVTVSALERGRQTMNRSTYIALMLVFRADPLSRKRLEELGLSDSGSSQTTYVSGSHPEAAAGEPESLREQLHIMEGQGLDYENAFLTELGEMAEDDRVFLFRGGNLPEETEKTPGVSAYSERMEMYREQFVCPEDYDFFTEETERENVLRKLEGERSCEFYCRVQMDGETGFSKIKFVPIRDGEGRIRKLIVAFSEAEDYTLDQYRQQEELERALEQAKAANEAKSNFLYNMSHDIRTPMNAIIGFNEVALSSMDDPEKVRDCLEKIRLSSAQLMSLIDDVLEMSSLEAGKEEVSSVSFSLRENAEEIMETIRGNTEKPLSVETDLSGLRHDYVHGDRIHINRILHNILSNSVKYTPAGGKILFSVREKESAQEGLSSYELIVEDTGVGIGKEYLGDIFELFSRERSSTQSGIQGTGLGMAIIKRLVDLLNGSIDIESTVGQGTRVSVKLEMNWTADPVEMRLPSRETDLSALQGKRILLVDDNELNREIAADILEEYGLYVEMAENGEEAVRLYEEALRRAPQERYQLILMDIQMPIMDGYEATRRIRSAASAWGTSVPIVALTANFFARDRKMALDSGMNEHLGKPIDRDRLEKVLCSFLN